MRRTPADADHTNHVRLATIAPSTDCTNSELANRLIDHADSITNHARHEMEADIRLAAERLRHIDDLVPLVPKLINELRRIALFSADLDIRRSLQALLGETAR